MSTIIDGRGNVYKCEKEIECEDLVQKILSEFKTAQEEFAKKIQSF